MTEQETPIFVYENVLKRILEVCREEEKLQKYEEAGDGIHFTAWIGGEGTLTFEVLSDKLTFTTEDHGEAPTVFKTLEQFNAWILFAIQECWASDLMDDEPVVPNLPD